MRVYCSVCKVDLAFEVQRIKAQFLIGSHSCSALQAIELVEALRSAICKLAQCSVHSAQCSIHSGQCTVLFAQCSVQSAECTAMLNF